jgi:hypothetical protein
MKKFFAIAFVAASLVACNGGGDKKEGTDTVTAPVDTVVAAPAPADTAATPAPADTAAAPADTTKK